MVGKIDQRLALGIHSTEPQLGGSSGHADRPRTNGTVIEFNTSWSNRIEAMCAFLIAKGRDRNVVIGRASAGKRLFNFKGLQVSSVLRCELSR
jgi:hypothetical protein